MNELRKNQVNLILETSPLDRPQVEKDGKVDISSFLPFAFYQVSINARLFPDARARAAMSMALDRAGLVPQVTDREDGVVLNYGPFPRTCSRSNIPEYVDTPVPNLLPQTSRRRGGSPRPPASAAGPPILLYPDSLGDFGTKMRRASSPSSRGSASRSRPRGPGNQVFRRMVYTEKSYELALVYCDGFDNLYSSLGQWYRSDGVSNISGIGDRELDRLFDQWDKAVVTAEWVDLTLRINERNFRARPGHVPVHAAEGRLLPRAQGRDHRDGQTRSSRSRTGRSEAEAMRFLRFLTRELLLRG